MQIKTTMRKHYNPPEWLKKGSDTTKIVDGDGDKWELLYIGNIN